MKRRVDEVDEVKVRWRVVGEVVMVEMVLGADVFEMTPELAADLEHGLGVHLAHILRFRVMRAERATTSR